MVTDAWRVGAPQALVLGGAGFLGSHIARRFVRAGWRVVVIDGILERTGADRTRVADLEGHLEFVARRVEEVPGLDRLLASSSVVVDSMAWTRHREGMADPVYDLQLNLAAHVSVVAAMASGGPARLVYLGSRGQYGQVHGGSITETTPQVPVDVQGIHKVAAESHFRVCAARRGLDLISLRLPNCFGPGQPLDGPDVGLLAGFLRDLLDRRTVEVYGEQRMRHLAYALDVAEIVWRLSSASVRGFTPLNYAGHRVAVGGLAHMLAETVGGGRVAYAAMPDDLARTDMGDALIVDAALRDRVGALPCTPLDDALAATVDDGRRRWQGDR